MGFLASFSPLRLFTVNMAPRDAVRLAITALIPHGFAVEPLDIDTQLAAHGDWTGVIVSEGSTAGGMAAEFAIEVFPPLVLLPGVRKQHGKVRIAVFAGPSANHPQVSELWFYKLITTQSNDYADPRGFFTKMTEEVIAATLASQRALIDGPILVPTAKIPRNHPFYHWRKLERAARKRRSR